MRNPNSRINRGLHSQFWSWPALSVSPCRSGNVYYACRSISTESCNWAAPVVRQMGVVQANASEEQEFWSSRSTSVGIHRQVRRHGLGGCPCLGGLLHERVCVYVVLDGQFVRRGWHPDRTFNT